MERFTDIEGKPVFVDTHKVTHVSIDAELGKPIIHLIGGSSATVVDDLQKILQACTSTKALA